jgi:hypothetical protein
VTPDNEATFAKYGKRPPYVSFRAIKHALTGLRSVKRGPTENISGCLGDGLSDSVRRQILTALRFLKLIDTLNCGTQRLEELLQYPDDSAEYSSYLRIILVDSYGITDHVAANGALVLAEIDSMLESYSSSPAVIAKIQKFFVEMAKAAGITVSRNGDEHLHGTGARQSETVQKRHPNHPAPRAARLLEHEDADIRPDQNFSRAIPVTKPHIREMVISLAQILASHPPENSELRAICETIGWLARLSTTE